MSGSSSSDLAHESSPHPRPAVAHREKLTPAPWVWASVILLAVMCGLAAWPFGLVVVSITWVVASATAVTTMLRWSPEIVVADGELRVGQAHVPVSLLGLARPLDTDQMRFELGRGLDVRSFLCIRGWIHTGVRVELVDPDDPTPYWLISTRSPEALAAAIEAARSAAGHAG